MDKSDPPRSLGVFKPVDHTVIAYANATDMQQAVQTLGGLGFHPEAFTRYTPAEMLRQVELDLKSASPLARFGYPLDLANANLARAKDGCSFLVVHVPTQEQADQVAEVVRAGPAVAAQHYGLLLILDLLEPGPGRMAQA